MSLFPAFPAPSDFGPLFRLLDDYDTHRSGRGQQTMRSFQPKFDVRETKDAYELHGELPGIDQKDVTIEFSDPTTLVIKGRVEREYSAGPEGHQQGRITGDVTDHDQNQGQTQPHKATVEDEGPEGQSQQQQQQQQQDNKQVQQQQKGDQQVAKKGHHTKYWVTERSVGEFYRSFSFPTRVDQDNVKASLKNGILSVTVPKAAAHQAKKINIE